MKTEKCKDKIVISGLEDFAINQILDCGQIFRYAIEGNRAVVYCKDKRAIIFIYEDKAEIQTDDVEFFFNFFDLSTNYTLIKQQLIKDEFLKKAVNYGSGIRILKNDAYEMLISFIISANNNISRIKKSINYLCEKFGTYIGEYFAFPTLKQLKTATVEDFVKAGLGYRAEQMFETVQRLTEKDIENLKVMEEDEQFKFLVSLKGVGEKVANCIMLFGLHAMDRFPVDTWINKVYNKLTNTNSVDRKKITKELTNRYKNLSGYAQQYFYYYFRETKSGKK